MKGMSICIVDERGVSKNREGERERRREKGKQYRENYREDIYTEREIRNRDSLSTSGEVLTIRKHGGSLQNCQEAERVETKPRDKIE